MSDIYEYRLRKVQPEYSAALAAVTFLTRNWNKHGFDDSFNGVTRATLQSAEENLEGTYFIRLYAEFEGILKDHLVSNHPDRAFKESERPKVDDVIARIVRGEKLTIAPALRAKLDMARDYRNSIAHSTRTAVPRVTFDNGIANLGKIVDMLSDPHS